MQKAKSIFNINKIENAKFSVVVKGGFTLLLLGLVVIGIWQQDAMKAWLGMDRFFKEQDEHFKILVLPFKQICQMGGKNYDAGYVLAERLQAIAAKENLKIKTKYWSSFYFEDFGDYKARMLQQYHRADMIVYGAYQTGDCSAEGDQICLNYITDEKWKLGSSGLNMNRVYQPGGLDELRKGKLQERVESIALFISILAQIKSIDRVQFLQELRDLLDNPKFGASSKAYILIELADGLRDEGNLQEPLKYYEQALQLFSKVNDAEGGAMSYERMGTIHKVIGDLTLALAFFEESNKLTQALHEAYPEDSEYQKAFAISCERLGSIHLLMANFDGAFAYFEEFHRQMKALSESMPENPEYKDGLAISLERLGSTHSKVRNWNKAFELFERYHQLEKDLLETHPQNPGYKNNLGWSNHYLGVAYTALGDIEAALKTFTEMARLFEELHEAHFHNVSFKDASATAYSNLGETYVLLGQTQNAFAYYEQSCQLRKELFAAWPQNSTFKNGLAIAYSKLGETHYYLEDFKQSMPYFEKMSTLFQELVEAYPQNVEFKNGLSVSYQFLGSTNISLGKYDEGLAFIKRFNQIASEFYSSNPKNISFKHDLAISLIHMGTSYLESSTDVYKAKKYLLEAKALLSELTRDFPQEVRFQRDLEYIHQLLSVF